MSQADEHMEEAKKGVQKALDSLELIASHRCSGAGEYQDLSEVIVALIKVRKAIGAPKPNS